MYGLNTERFISYKKEKVAKFKYAASIEAIIRPNSNGLITFRNNSSIVLIFLLLN